MNTTYPYFGEVTIGDRYQAVIPKNARRIAKKLTVGTKAMVVPINERTVIVSAKSKNWVEETRGMFKGMWKGDATDLIRKLRDEEWE